MWEARYAFHICIAHCELFWRSIGQRAVWTHLVVIDSPLFDGFPGIVQRQEPVQVQAFLAELAVEAFNIAILHRPSRRDEGQLDLIVVSPLGERFRCELSAIVDDDPLRKTSADS